MKSDFNWRLPESGFPGQFLKPTPFFVGVFFGFLICCILGYLCAANQSIDRFRRFHFYISPYTFYFPTFGQLESLTKSARDDQTYVIVGGSSLFKGYGQRPEDLWTEKLQKDLGKNYFVINYAIDGGTAFEGGSWIAEMLLKRSRKVIFITNAEPRKISSVNGWMFKHAFFDFYNGNHLLPSPSRDEALREALNPQSENANNEMIENELGKRVDRYTNSSELWQWVGHNLFFTIWSYGTHPAFLQPRRMFSDSEPVTFERDEEVYETKKTIIVDDESSIVSKGHDGEWAPNQSSWSKADLNAQTIPSQLLQHSIVFVPRYSPQLLDHFSEDELERHDAVLKIASDKWKSVGAQSFPLSGFQSDCYLDMLHFSPSGGTQLARMVAEKIRSRAKELGYE